MTEHMMRSGDDGVVWSVLCSVLSAPSIVILHIYSHIATKIFEHDYSYIIIWNEKKHLYSIYKSKQYSFIWTGLWHKEIKYTLYFTICVSECGVCWAHSRSFSLCALLPYRIRIRVNVERELSERLIDGLQNNKF